MKTLLKRITAVLLVLSILFVPTVFAYADDYSDDEAVVTVSLGSCIYVWPFSGHTWIYVENLTDEPLQVGAYELPVGQGVSVGCFSFTVKDGWGLYYNLEAYRENKHDRFDTHWTKTTTLNKSEFEKFSKKLLNFPNTWSPVINCATFAFSMWNSVSNDVFISLLIPAISQFEVIIGGGKKGVQDMYYPTRNQVLRQRGRGENAYLEPVSDATYDR